MPENTPQEPRNNPIDTSVLKYDEPASVAHSSRQEPRLEETWAYLPRVSAQPDWLPRKFGESLALDEAAYKLWYYDFDNQLWKYVDHITLTAGTGITITPSGQDYTIAASAPSQLVTTLTAGEAISSKDAVVIGETPTTASPSNFTGYTAEQDLSNAAFSANNGLVAQTFVAGSAYLHKIECEVQQDDLSSCTYQIEIQTTSGGAPSGSTVSGSVTSYSVTDSVNSGGSQFSATALFDYSTTPVTLTPGTTYAIVMRYSSYSGLSAPTWGYTNGNSYASGAMYTYSSGWSAPNGGSNDMSFKVYSSATKGGFIFKADASTNDSLANNFIGFADAAISADAAGTIVVGGIVTGMAGLTPGATYYLSDTSGAISTTAGAQSRKVGKALSSSTLLIKHDNS